MWQSQSNLSLTQLNQTKPIAVNLQNYRWRIYPFQMVLPVIKLGSLLVRTISKPISVRLKRAAVYHPRFRRLIVDLAQGYHRLTTLMQRHTLGRSPALGIRPLNEERAVEAATDLLRELFVFSVAGFAILYEVQRTTRAETKKEEMRKQQIEMMNRRNEALEADVKHLRQRLEQLEVLAKQRVVYRVWTWRAYENPSLGNNKVR